MFGIVGFLDFYRFSIVSYFYVFGLVIVLRLVGSGLGVWFFYFSVLVVLDGIDELLRGVCKVLLRWIWLYCL